MLPNLDVLLYDLTGTAFIAALPREATWRHSIRRNGGFWQASGEWTGDQGPLCNAFQTWLGYCVRERSGGQQTWEGLVYELELVIGGERRRRTLDLVRNAVLTTYQDAGVVAETAYATQAQSITRYGRQEERLMLDNYPLATAEDYRDSFLKERAWPWPRPVGMEKPGEVKLTLRACGYVFTANWMFVEEGDGTADDLDDWLQEIVGTATGLSANHGGAVAGAGDCQFLTVGSVSANTLQVNKASSSPVRAWDVLQELAALGDASGNAWSVWVDLGQLVHYQMVTTTPRYFLRGGALYDSPGTRNAVNPWTVRPAVVRNMDYPLRVVETGSLLADARDSLIEEVEVDSTGKITLRPTAMLESDILAAQYEEYGAPEEGA